MKTCQLLPIYILLLVFNFSFGQEKINPAPLEESKLKISATATSVSKVIIKIEPTIDYNKEKVGIKFPLEFNATPFTELTFKSKLKDYLNKLYEYQKTTKTLENGLKGIDTVPSKTLAKFFKSNLKDDQLKALFNTTTTIDGISNILLTITDEKLKQTIEDEINKGLKNRIIIFEDEFYNQFKALNSKKDNGKKGIDYYEAKKIIDERVNALYRYFDAQLELLFKYDTEPVAGRLFYKTKVAPITYYQNRRYETYFDNQTKNYHKLIKKLYKLRIEDVDLTEKMDDDYIVNYLINKKKITDTVNRQINEMFEKQKKSLDSLISSIENDDHHLYFSEYYKYANKILNTIESSLLNNNFLFLKTDFKIHVTNVIIESLKNLKEGEIPLTNWVNQKDNIIKDEGTEYYSNKVTQYQDNIKDYENNLETINNRLIAMSSTLKNNINTYSESKNTIIKERVSAEILNQTKKAVNNIRNRFLEDTLKIAYLIKIKTFFLNESKEYSNIDPLTFLKTYDYIINEYRNFNYGKRKKLIYNSLLNEANNKIYDSLEYRIKLYKRSKDNISDCELRNEFRGEIIELNKNEYYKSYQKHTIEKEIKELMNELDSYIEESKIDIEDKSVLSKIREIDKFFKNRYIRRRDKKAKRINEIMNKYPYVIKEFKNFNASSLIDDDSELYYGYDFIDLGNDSSYKFKAFQDLKNKKTDEITSSIAKSEFETNALKNRALNLLNEILLHANNNRVINKELKELYRNSDNSFHFFYSSFQNYITEIIEDIDEPSKRELILTKKCDDKQKDKLRKDKSESLSKILVLLKKTPLWEFEIDDMQLDINDGFVEHIVINGKITSISKDNGKRKEFNDDLAIIMKENPDWKTNIGRQLKFVNIFPYGFSSSKDFDDFKEYEVSVYKGKHKEFVVDLESIFPNYVQTLQNDRLDFSPRDQVVTLPINDEKEGAIELKKDKSSKLFNLSIYSDFNGLKASDPNGILQFKFNKPIPLYTKRGTWKLAGRYLRGFNYGYFNFIDPTLTWSRLDANDNTKSLTISYLDAFNGNTSNRIPYVTQLDLLRYENISIGTDVNLMSLDFPIAKLRFEFNVSARYGRTRIIDTDGQSITDNQENLNIKKIYNINTWRFYPDFTFRLRPEERYGATVHFRPMRFNSVTNDFSNISSEKSFLETLEDKKQWLHQIEINAHFSPSSLKDDRFFFRYRYTNTANWEYNGFSEMQVGYSMSLKF